MSAFHHFDALAGRIERFGKSGIKTVYAIPDVWMPSAVHSNPIREIRVDPAEYFLDGFAAIRKRSARPLARTQRGEWTHDAVIYNMMVRTTLAYDHNGDGRLNLPVNPDGWRETGTLTKAIALLPYIVGLGANTIHLLPITSIGSDGNKGTLGSPYAIKNPYELDPNLSEPNLEAGVEEEFGAFVEAAHHLGCRIVVEFVFRTAAKDADWVKEHPDWFYWIKASIPDREPGSKDEHAYGSPVFTKEELAEIRDIAERRKKGDLIPPHTAYLEMFTDPPSPSAVVLENGKYIGTLPDKTRVRIPGAFADWPPDDLQPPWGDVTYLRMYDHPDFNYMAYNTLRMYDTRLVQSPAVNKPLWEKIANIVPHYQQTFGIDGVMIDMGHALPMELKQEMIRRARAINPDFAFWDENFSVDEKSVKEGYNAVIGYQWSDQHHPEKFGAMLKRFGGEGFPLSFFATPESHNTPRAAARKGGVRYARYAWAISNFLPVIPFIHSGFELAETYPINTGLDFTSEDLKKLPSEKLPLFSDYAMTWTRDEAFIDWIQRISAIRERYHRLISDPSPQSFVWIEIKDRHLLAFERRSGEGGPALLVLANADMKHAKHLRMPLPPGSGQLIDLLTDHPLHVRDGAIDEQLEPGRVCVTEL